MEAFYNKNEMPAFTTDMVPILIRGSKKSIPHPFYGWGMLFLLIYYKCKLFNLEFHFVI